MLYEELLSFYSGVVVLVEEAVKLTEHEKEDPKKVECIVHRRRSTPRAKQKF